MDSGEREASFPHNHRRNNGQRWERNSSHHQTSERILAKPGDQTGDLMFLNPVQTGLSYFIHNLCNCEHSCNYFQAKCSPWRLLSHINIVQTIKSDEEGINFLVKTIINHWNEKLVNTWIGPTSTCSQVVYAIDWPSWARHNWRGLTVVSLKGRLPQTLQS